MNKHYLKGIITVYETSPTALGNIGVSRISMEEAQAQAGAMDESGCTGCKNCRDCEDCTDCTDCANCIACVNISNSHQVRRWDGNRADSPAERVVGLTGLYWSVATDGKRIQIGCENHTVEEWEAFTRDEIRVMSSRAFAFWSDYKDSILTLARARRAR